MIKNELQYKLTKTSAENFERRLNWLRENPGAQAHLDPILAKAEEDGLQSMIDEMREELQEYERTKQGDVDMTALTSVHMVPSTLIRARIARGLSQRQLAPVSGSEGAADSTLRVQRLLQRGPGAGARDSPGPDGRCADRSCAEIA